MQFSQMLCYNTYEINQTIQMQGYAHVDVVLQFHPNPKHFS